MEVIEKMLSFQKSNTESQTDLILYETNVLRCHPWKKSNPKSSTLQITSTSIILKYGKKIMKESIKNVVYIRTIPEENSKFAICISKLGEWLFHSNQRESVVTCLIDQFWSQGHRSVDVFWNTSHSLHQSHIGENGWCSVENHEFFLRKLQSVPAFLSTKT